MSAYGLSDCGCTRIPRAPIEDPAILKEISDCTPGIKHLITNLLIEKFNFSNNPPKIISPVMNIDHGFITAPQSSGHMSSGDLCLPSIFWFGDVFLDMTTWNRRGFLAAVGATGSLGITGCLGDETGENNPGGGDECVEDDDADVELEGDVCPSDDEPPAIPDSLDCPDEELEDAQPEHDPFDPTRIEPLHSEHTVNWGSGDVFAMRTAESTYELGETAKITLKNISGEDEEIHQYSSFNFEIETADGWQDVRINTASIEWGFHDDGGTFEAGSTIKYEIDLTEEGIVEASYMNQNLVVCPDLQVGRYRFVFANHFGREEAVAVAFDLIDDW